MMAGISAKNEILDLIRFTIPEKAGELDQDCSISSIVDITKKWIISPESRLKPISEDRYTIYSESCFQILSRPFHSIDK
ncbi:MAG: hypothetical protein ACRDFB_09595 [Rhabdochlamydiaceae bacterium]